MSLFQAFFLLFYFFIIHFLNLCKLQNLCEYPIYNGSNFNGYIISKRNNLIEIIGRDTGGANLRHIQLKNISKILNIQLTAQGQMVYPNSINAFYNPSIYNLTNTEFTISPRYGIGTGYFMEQVFFRVIAEI